MAAVVDDAPDAAGHVARAAGDQLQRPERDRRADRQILACELARSAAMRGVGIGFEKQIDFASGLGGHQQAAAKAAGDAPAQCRDVVLVGVRDDDRVGRGELVRRDRRIVIGAARAGLHAGIEQQTVAVDFDTEAGAALFAEASIKMQPHEP